MEHATKKQKQLHWTAPLITVLGAVLLLCLLTASLMLFDRYTQEQLYSECVSQLTEISAQLFEKLEVQLNVQWGYLKKMDADLAGCDQMTDAELRDFLARREQELSPVGESMEFLALDSHGYYYTDQGQQGLWSGAASVGEAENQSFLINDWLTSANRMALVHKLHSPLTVNGSAITHFILLKDMDEMAPYFRSSAFHNQNSTFVLDANGVRMFEDNVLPGLDFQGRNLYHALREQTYSHMGSFDACLSVVQERSFVCTDVQIGDSEYYLTMKKLDGYDWTMLFLVPVSEVGASTRAMTGSLVRLFLGILMAAMLFCVVGFFFLTRFRKNQELLALRTRSAAELAEANRSLEDANAKLEVTNHDLEATNQKLEQAQTAATEALAVAENASKAKTDFLSNMSHDIRTPMNAIVGLSNMIEREADDPEKVLLHIHKLQSSSQHLLGIINDILDMNKIESGKTTLNIEPVCLTDQITQLETMIRPQVQQQGQTLTVHTENLQHNNILADATRVQQVLVNILSNAVKYTPEGGAIDFRIEELPRKGHIYAKYRFTVTDNGIGMEPEFLAHIFDPFVRAESSLTNKVQGTGLGMAITKSLVELMGGTIHVESTPGKGSTFAVTLNFKIDTDVSHAKERSEAPAPADGDSVLKGMRFLCAEDNPLNAEILQAILEMNGASCTICSNGQEIVDKFAAVKPGEYDMILMDVQMPVMDGHAAARAIRSGPNPLGKEIPILAMTANAFTDDIQKSYDAGMDAHLSKPVDIPTLEATIRKFRVPPPPENNNGKLKFRSSFFRETLVE